MYDEKQHGLIIIKLQCREYGFRSVCIYIAFVFYRIICLKIYFSQWNVRLLRNVLTYTLTIHFCSQEEASNKCASYPLKTKNTLSTRLPCEMRNFFFILSFFFTLFLMSIKIEVIKMNDTLHYLNCFTN